ncbi:MAG TPA: hypothetical protein VN920_04910 [Pyrinomonadaceae bacterium]|nr:hypothetical protein [Pyrinomonadaceae bacterium]
MLSVPTPDHYLPLLYVIALQNKGDEISFPIAGVDGGSMDQKLYLRHSAAMAYGPYNVS